MVRVSDVAELAAAFDVGALVRPKTAVPHLVDVARAVATASAMGGLASRPSRATSPPRSQTGKTRCSSPPQATESMD